MKIEQPVPIPPAGKVSSKPWRCLLGSLALAAALCNPAGALATNTAPIDPTFQPGKGADDTISTAVVLPSGKILIGGYFKTFNGEKRAGIARLHPDGSLDSKFDPGAGVDGGVIAILPLDKDRVLIGGDFTQFDGKSSRGILALNDDGSLDTNFDVGSGISGSDTPAVMALGLQSDGKIIVGGFFDRFDGTPRNNLIRLNPKGDLDTSFGASLPPNIEGGVIALAVQPDDGIVMGGLFNRVNGVTRRYLARLNSNGTLDAGFTPSISSALLVDGVFAIAIEEKGGILIGGFFDNIGGKSRRNIARLTSQGLLDSSFDPGLGLSDQVLTVQVDSIGRVLVGGYFTVAGGKSQARLTRLTTTGAVDPDFVIGAGATHGVIVDGENPTAVFALVPYSNGDVLVAGEFTQFDNRAFERIVRLADGPVLRIVKVVVKKDEVVFLTIEGPVGGQYVVEATENLKEWVKVLEFTSTLPQTTIEIPDSAVIKYRCFRVRLK